MNSAYIGALMELAEKNSNVIHLLADSGTGYDEMFRRCFPQQMYNFGIAEENMVSAAAGMAMTGKIPFVFTAGAFLAYRALEFIRDDICFQNLNVKIIGMGSGLSWSSLGPTHHTTEDIAVLRALPNIMILSPATPNQVKACVRKAYEHLGPVYIKIGMNHEQEYFADNCAINSDGFDVIDISGDDSDCMVFVTGSILQEVVNAAAILKVDGISVKIVNMVKLKPLEAINVIKIAETFKNIFTVEEHNIIGGLGGILAEIISYNGLNKKIIPIGLKDRFAVGYGTHEIVRKRNNLSAQQIAKTIKEAM